MQELKQDDVMAIKITDASQDSIPKAKSNSDRPRIKQWSKNNPLASINDYCRIYGASWQIIDGTFQIREAF